jgi:hypothetical protein
MPSDISVVQFSAGSFQGMLTGVIWGLSSSLRLREPFHTLRLHILAANGVIDAGTNIGASIFARAAESKLFTFGVHRLTSRLSVEGHADFYAEARAVYGGIHQERKKDNRKQRDHETNLVFQSTPS